MCNDSSSLCAMTRHLYVQWHVILICNDTASLSAMTRHLYLQWHVIFMCNDTASLSAMTRHLYVQWHVIFMSLANVCPHAASTHISIHKNSGNVSSLLRLLCTTTDQKTFEKMFEERRGSTGRCWATPFLGPVDDINYRVPKTHIMPISLPCTFANYRVPKTYIMSYLYRSFSAQKPYN